MGRAGRALPFITSMSDEEREPRLFTLTEAERTRQELEPILLEAIFRRQSMASSRMGSSSWRVRSASVRVKSLGSRSSSLMLVINGSARPALPIQLSDRKLYTPRLQTRGLVPMKPLQEPPASKKGGLYVIANSTCARAPPWPIAEFGRPPQSG